MNKDFFKIRFLGLLIALAVIAGSSIVAMLLWNALMPGIFALPVLNYWQTLGLAVLCRIFLGGIPLGHIALGFGQGGRDFHHGNKMREKWMAMSDEERKAFIEKEGDFRALFHDRFSHLHRFYEKPETAGKKDEDHE
ncbi:MAG: hypothetical protein LBB48_06230 [Treponema sp.]|jgi:hypothetical protein|nr:hypothetical protein [Treponema sp.]